MNDVILCGCSCGGKDEILRDVLAAGDEGREADE